MAMNDWMGRLLQNGGLALHEVTLPGSHDAGIFPDSVQSVGKVSDERTVCQRYNIYDQCVNGSRFFDIRLRSHSGAVKTFHQAEMKRFFFAGPKIKLPLGAVGTSLNEVLGHVHAFVKGNQTEFVILRLSHTFANTEYVKEYVSNHPINEVLYKQAGNLAQATVGQLAGHAILVCDSKFDHDPYRGIHKFAKYSGDPVNSGLATCGEFSDESSIRRVLAKQIRRVSEHEGHNQGDHLFVLYWQQTGGNVRERTEKQINVNKSYRKGRASGGTHHNMDYMIEVLTHGGSRYGEDWHATTLTWADRRRCMPNVVLYDFVNSEISAKIADLNDPGLRAYLAPN